MLENNPIVSSIWYWAFYQGHNLNHFMELGNKVILSDNKRRKQGQKRGLETPAWDEELVGRRFGDHLLTGRCWKAVGPDSESWSVGTAG